MEFDSGKRAGKRPKALVLVLPDGPDGEKRGVLLNPEIIGAYLPDPLQVLTAELRDIWNKIKRKLFRGDVP